MKTIKIVSNLSEKLGLTGLPDINAGGIVIRHKICTNDSMVINTKEYTCVTSGSGLSVYDVVVGLLLKYRIKDTEDIGAKCINCHENGYRVSDLNDIAKALTKAFGKSKTIRKHKFSIYKKALFVDDLEFIPLNSRLRDLQYTLYNTSNGNDKEVIGKVNLISNVRRKTENIMYTDWDKASISIWTKNIRINGIEYNNDAPSLYVITVDYEYAISYGLSANLTITNVVSGEDILEKTKIMPFSNSELTYTNNMAFLEIVKLYLSIVRAMNYLGKKYMDIPLGLNINIGRNGVANIDFVRSATDELCSIEKSL